MKIIFTIIKKELLDALRDKKSLSTALLVPVVFALVSFGMPKLLLSIHKSSDDLTLPVQGMEKIVPLVDFLEEQGIHAVEAPDNPEQAILKREANMVLVVPKGFENKFRKQQTATLNLLSDHSHSAAMSDVGRVQQAIQHWSTLTGSLRLITRGVSPQIAHPLNISRVNVTSPSRLAGQALSMLPMFIVLITFVSGIGMIADMASGERERLSLEPLLTNPITPSQVFSGKLLAAAAVTFCIAIFGLSLQFLSVSQAPIAELGLKLELSVAKFLIILVLLFPLAILASALQLLVSFFARSFKDAQTYNTFFSFIPMAPGIYLAFHSGSAEQWQMFIPLLGQTTLLFDIFFGESIDLIYIVIASTVTLALAAIAAMLGVEFLKREKTVLT